MVTRTVRTTCTVNGNAVTQVLRAAWDRNDFESMAEACPGMACAEVVAVGKREARVEGNSHDGFTVVSER